MNDHANTTVKSIFPARWTRILCILAGLYAIPVALYISIEAEQAAGLRDFHTFWYAGHFIRQGEDPYGAYFASEQPQLPVKYLDGVTVSNYPVAQGDLSIIPSNTPTMLLLLTPFSYFSWEVAKRMFLVVNLILMLSTGWLVVRRLPFGKVKLAPLDELLLFFVFFDLSATRKAVENGQTTLLVFVLILIAVLYAKQSWQVAGLALGLALSKYSFAPAPVLFFLYKTRFRVLLVAALIQAVGVLALAAIVRTSPLLIAMENTRMFFLFFNVFSEGGVHLAKQFQALTTNRILMHIPVLVMTLLVILPLFFWLRRRNWASSYTKAVIDFHLLTILFLWTLLTGYHSSYDTLIVLLFLVLVFKGLAYPNIWRLNRREKTMLMVFLAAMPLVLILPARLVDKQFPHYYGTIYSAITSISLIIMLIFSLFLLLRYLQSTLQETKPENGFQ